MPPPFADLRLGQPGDLAACKQLLRGGSRSFHLASLLLPRSVRDPACALYAFCRLADDAVDLGGGRVAAVARLRERLARAYEGRPLPLPADRALADVVARHAIPPALPEALLEGFLWDAEGRTYETLAELHAYAARVAGAVGAMMAVLMGARAPEDVARACDLGVAMQLSNIARDVGEDAREGRLYLPLAWLREAGIDPAAWRARPHSGPALRGVVLRLLAEAERLYDRAMPGVAGLPLACRPGIGAARLLYRAIGREVGRAGGESVASRAVVPAWRKVALLAAGLGAAAARRDARGETVAAAQFLVAAVARSAPPPRPASQPRGVSARLVWTLELFERLERHEVAG